MSELVKPCPWCGSKTSVDERLLSQPDAKTVCHNCGNSFLVGVAPSCDKPADERASKNITRAQELLDAGLRLGAEGKHGEAVVSLRAAAKNSPLRVDILLALGKACGLANLAYDSLAAYTKIVDINPRHEEALFKAGVILIQQKRYSQGIKRLERLLEINSTSQQAELMIKIAQAKMSEAQQEPVNAPIAIQSEKSFKWERMGELVGLMKNTTPSTKALASLWIAMPVIFSVVYKMVEQNFHHLDTLLIAILLYCVFFGVVWHELGHGVAAYLSGDDTAYRSGRLTLNPLSHISFIGTIVTPITVYTLTGVAFGWAKPVPFNPLHLKSQPRDTVVVAGAGPLASFTLSYITFILFLIVASVHNATYPATAVFYTMNLAVPFEVGAGSMSPVWFVALETLAIASVVNLILGVFNLIPIPPLDGSWLLRSVAPPAMAGVMDKSRWIGLALIVGCVYSGWIVYLFYPAYIILAGYHYLAGTLL